MNFLPAACLVSQRTVLQNLERGVRLLSLNSGLVTKCGCDGIRRCIATQQCHDYTEKKYYPSLIFTVIHCFSDTSHKEHNNVLKSQEPRRAYVP